MAATSASVRVVEVLVSFYRCGEENAFEMHGSRIPIGKEQRNITDAKKHLINFLGISQMATSLGMGNFELKLYRLASMKLVDVEMMKPLKAARIDPPIEVAMKELVDKYRPVRQRTVRSETTKEKAGALPPAVYNAQPPRSKVRFHDDSTVEGQERIEQIIPQVTDDDGDSHIPSITFVNDSAVEIVAVGEVPDQED
ncbi:hypothetical protein AWC38_SpisGene7874 [Stylophora pistillata]|uniref:Uncharacterized protein n=1 Tax=Stylophora pistillata TaxID=50429 RepID=A0A2B4SFR8_STYPI|nr:hypothetical protein AWC38_SpisGene7874 [Stylophora pistillata]